MCVLIGWCANHVTLYDVHTMTKSPNDAFLGTYRSR